MQEKLIVYISSHDAPPVCVLSPSGQTVALADAGRHRDVVVLVPAQDVLLHSAALPKMNRARLTQALPFALEDQLIDDVNTLHFAWGDYQSNGELPVAVVSHAKMQHWNAILAEYHIVPDHLLPVSLALPWQDNQLHVWLNDIAIARTGLYQGFTCDAANLAAWIDVSKQHLSLNAIELNNYSGEEDLPALAEVKESVFLPEQFVTHLAQQAGPFPSLNLLQGKYTVKKNKLPELKKIKQAAAMVGAAWLAMLILSPFISFLILQHKTSEITSQMQVIYREQFPQASSMVAPKFRMEEKLQKLSSGLGANRFLLLLAETGKALQQTASVKLKRFDYQTNQLTLEVTASTSDDFNRFTDYLTQRGLTVRQQNANLAGDRINASVVVE